MHGGKDSWQTPALEWRGQGGTCPFLHQILYLSDHRASGIRVADLCTFLQNMHDHARTAAQLNLASVARFRHVLRNVLSHLMVTGAYS